MTSMIGFRKLVPDNVVVHLEKHGEGSDDQYVQRCQRGDRSAAQRTTTRPTMQTAHTPQ
jgi:hypothetical protein